jgi:hypothetical protein
MNKPVFLLLVLLVSCNEQTGSFSEQQVEKEARRMLINYHHDIQQDGLLAEFNYLDSSDQFFWIPPGYEVPLSYDSVRKILEGNAPLFLQADFQWDTLNVIPLSEKIATYAGVVIGKMTDTTGQITISTILESGTLIKRDNGWNLLSGQSVLLN